MIILKFLSNISVWSMNIFSLLLTIYGLKSINKIENLKIFILIPLLSFIDSLSLVFFTQILDRKNLFYNFSEYFQIIYLCTELSLIILFYLRFILKIRFRLYYFISIISITIFLFLKYFTKLNIAVDYLPAFVVIETLIVNIFFGIIFSHRIKEDGIIIEQWQNKLNQGFFLFVNITAPYYLIINYLDHYQNVIATYLNFIGSFGYIILFYHIYKSMKCYQLS